MLITTIVLALMAQSPSAAVDTTRAAFTKCLRTDMKKALEAKMEEAEYEMTVKANCSTERDAFRKAVIALGRSGGDSEKLATEDAEMQIDDYHANFTDKFKDYKSSNTLPGD
ncbi:hypothetical protein [Sphingopyxis sp. RIFCSPHIGHO2_12_FULL_65_19]|uniref:hypothetical protein n=1 Tax=Sphingopyxis sp. RIFCSPHIGHO2_12_FULL_65_19 TaxID=1802172 RepID=UPI0008AABA76|nr:hypothetical protein [Sphingopyxis sp. RIFCSPHIGHO2_12_FULL_65_19]OHD04446.1 MAG: hypothetical protein A3E77_16675 [Sphingopyxis sp. RIFCSPHIGHO2_12_FULL_65_19]